MPGGLAACIQSSDLKRVYGCTERVGAGGVYADGATLLITGNAPGPHREPQRR